MTHSQDHRDAQEQLDCQSIPYVETLLAQYAEDPAKVAPVWRDYFRELVGGPQQVSGWVRRPSFRPFSLFNPPPLPEGPAAEGPAAEGPSREASRPAPPEFDGAQLQDRVDQLVRAFRVRGHLAAKLDPLGFAPPLPEELTLGRYGLTPQDLDHSCSSLAVGGPDTQTVGSILQRLQNTYCRYIGAQFMHIDAPQVRDWLSQRMESRENRLELSHAEQLRILTRLTDAVIFEEFVRKKYVGAKTFSLEGAETLIPLLDLAMEKAGRQGIAEIVFGMAHRGRLNVLANIIGKRPQDIFSEFADLDPHDQRGSGDVKYHLGHSGDWTTAAGRRLHLSLCFNPSHLEFVNPVALGRMRAKQDRAEDGKRERGLVILIHGDASFAGEGIVQETLNMSQLAGYHVGGCLHIIVNNQLGFTTSPAEGRSTRYASDVAKMLQSPIFQVNGEHPEAVAQAVDLALEFRKQFRRDVVLDMYCYRRWGHNEADEPSFTQPVMYQAIEHRESVRTSYLEHLLSLNSVTGEEAERIAVERRHRLQDEFEQARDTSGALGRSKAAPTLSGVWESYVGGSEPADSMETGTSADQLAQLLLKLAEVPRDFHLHRKLQRFVENRRQMAEGKKPIDWSAAEALAFATLAVEGHPVRLTGQDSARGTFSQRHAIWYDTVDGHTYCPLEHLAAKQARVEMINSPLCESGTLGFEYGYSLDCPEALVVWEAQFGDFWNAGQVIVDQFIASAEAKWQRLSGIMMLLPHGFEGQGPEHSSARLERFLDLAAEDNIQIVCPSTPAQYFHCLRRQVLRPWRKPLVMLAPKSLLRAAELASSLDELAAGQFQRILADPRNADDDPAARVIMCSGKIYYALHAAQQRQQGSDTALVRIEQFYPLSDQLLQAFLERFPLNTPIVWVQEEPANMGAWPYWRALWRSAVRQISADCGEPSSGGESRHGVGGKASTRTGRIDSAGLATLCQRSQPPAVRTATRRGQCPPPAKVDDAMTTELKVPDVGTSVQEVQIAEWFKQEGATVGRDENLVQLETDKATLDLPAPISGTLTKIIKHPGESVAVGETIAYLEESPPESGRTAGERDAAARPAVSPAAPRRKSAAAKVNDAGRPGVQVTPSGRHALHEHGLSADQVSTGDRPLRREDVERYVEQQSSRPASEPPSAATGPATPDPAAPTITAPGTEGLATSAAGEEIVPMSLIRRRIAERLVRAQQEAALLTTFNEIDMSSVVQLRKDHQQSFQDRYGVKLGFMSFFVKASIAALQQFPQLNAEVRGTDIVYRNHYHIGIAIGGGKGLVVPVLKHAERLSMAELERAIVDFAARVRGNKITPDELQGGTFTITNGGVYGSLLSTPIVNPPQTGVLGMHAIEDRPVAREGQVVIRPMMYIALTYDHRIVDGAEAVTFLKQIKEAIQDPARMLIEV